MKKVLVTGGSGFIGRHFRRLIENDFEVINYDLKENLDIRQSLPRMEFDYVVHFAAKRNVSESELYPKDYIDTNCWGTLNLLKYYAGTRFINISSSSVNDVKSVYGATKQFAESMANRGENSLNIRLYNVFGESQPLESGAVLTNFINAKRNGEPPIIYGSGDQKRDFTYVGDVVESILHAMISKETGTVHFGYGHSISVMDILLEVYGEIPKCIHKPTRGFEIKNSVSPTPLPIIKYGRSEGLKRTIKWYESSLTRV